MKGKKLADKADSAISLLIRLTLLADASSSFLRGIAPHVISVVDKIKGVFTKTPDKKDIVKNASKK